MRRLVLTFVLCLATAQAMAAPRQYRLDTARSSVGFTYSLNGTDTAGRMPVATADMRLDLADIAASRVDVTLDPTGARAGIFLATQAMKGPKVLATDRYPEIRFRSGRITGTLQAARVTGDLTVRGVTRRVTLNAGLYRQRGTDPADTDHLTVLLTGQIDRRDYGAGGFAGVVGPMIALRILARIER